MMAGIYSAQPQKLEVSLMGISEALAARTMSLPTKRSNGQQVYTTECFLRC